MSDNSSTHNTNTVLPEPSAPPPPVTIPGETGHPPGVLHSTTMPHWTPDEAKREIESRPVPTVTFTDAQLKGKQPFAPQLLDAGVVQGPTSIVELARALNNDPNLIYQFVHDNISYYPIFGVSKGPLGALIDGAGSPFDQAMLMVALLRQAGYTANYVLGQIELTAAQIASWLGCLTDAANANTAGGVLIQGGIPSTWTTNGDGSLNTITLTHCWVQVDISGTLYVYDPSFKAHTYTTGINLQTATGYVQTDLINAMTTGATIDPNGDFVQNLNHTAMNAQLATYATNLVNYIKSNMPNATMDDVIGGRTIVPATIPLAQTALPYEAPGDVPTIWTGDIPTNYKISVTVSVGNIYPPLSFTSDQLYGHRLSSVYVPGSSPVYQLLLDGVVLATTTSSNAGTLVQVFPNAYPNHNNDYSYYSPYSGGYISLGFGTPSRGLSEYHRRLMQQALASGLSTDSESVYGEASAVIGNDYFAQWCKAVNLCLGVLDTSGGYSVVYHSYVGQVFVGLFDGGAGPFSYLYLNSSLPTVDAACGGFLGPWASGMEAVMFRQNEGNGLSAGTYVPYASQAGYKIFYTTGANLANVKSQCTFWNQYAIGLVEANHLISQHGGLQIDQWKGDAWLALAVNGFGGLSQISGNLNGGAMTLSTDTLTYVTGVGKNQRKPEPRPGESIGDPIDVFTGNFLNTSTDLSVGSADFPYSLLFERTYDSSNLFNDDVLGLGWTHNYKWNVAVNSDGYLAMGENSPIEGAAAIVAVLATSDIASGVTVNYTTVQAAAVALCEYWMVGQITSNTVVMKTPSNNEVFVKLADGSYHSPLGLTGTLTLTGGLYKYTTPQKVAYNFNSAGDLATIVYPNGVTVTLTYTAGALTSISNGMGRTLTLNYTAGRLTSVTDGTGRSVSYLVDANKNLTQFTDANGKLTNYSYGSPGQMTQMFLPQNPANAVVTNTFDSLGRIMTQADGLSNLSTYRFAGSRSQQTDPVGNNKVWYFNRYGDITSVIDALANTTVNVFDGLRRLSSKTFPEGNKLSYLYDSLNNVLQVTAQPKSGSPLANITRNFTYDATYNKVHTAQDGRGNTTTYNFDPATGNLLNIQRPVIGGFTPTVTFTYNGRGQVLTRTDETGIVTQYNFDVATEKLLSKVVDFGISPHLNLTTQYGYNTVGDVTSIIDARTNTTTFLVDLLRRTTQKTDSTPFSYITKWTYDDNNQLIKIERQTGDALNPWQTTQVGYSLTGKRKTVTDPSSNVFTYVYDTADRLWKMTDAENRTYQAAYDTLNRISTITDPTSTVAETRTYTVNGRLYQLTDARGNTTTYSFDGFDRPDRETFPDGSYEQQQSYDGNVSVRSPTW